MAEVWDTIREEETWNPRFTRYFNDWEIDEVQNFINLISRKKINQLEKRNCFARGIKMESS